MENMKYTSAHEKGNNIEEKLSQVQEMLQELQPDLSQEKYDAYESELTELVTSIKGTDEKPTDPKNWAQDVIDEVNADEVLLDSLLDRLQAEVSGKGMKQLKDNMENFPPEDLHTKQ